MAEHGNEHIKITGETTVTPSSDEAIQANVDQLRNQIAGLPTNPVIFDGEAFAPKVVGIGQSIGQGSSVSSVEPITTALGIVPKDSPFHIQESRSQLTIARMTGDSVAFTQIKRAA